MVQLQQGFATGDMGSGVRLHSSNLEPRKSRFTISLKRSTQNLQLSTNSPADYPIFVPLSDIRDPWSCGSITSSSPRTCYALTVQNRFAPMSADVSFPNL